MDGLPEPFHGWFESGFEGDVGFPVQLGSSQVNDRLPLKRLDLIAHSFSQLSARELSWIADVDWACRVVIHEPDHSFDQVIDLAERAGLVAIAIKGQGLSLRA